MFLVAILMESVCNQWPSNEGSYHSCFKAGLSVSSPLNQDTIDTVSFETLFKVGVIRSSPSTAEAQDWKMEQFGIPQVVCRWVIKLFLGSLCEPAELGSSPWQVTTTLPSQDKAAWGMLPLGTGQSLISLAKFQFLVRLLVLPLALTQGHEFPAILYLHNEWNSHQ